jgi:hypothetical protein
VCVCVCKHTHTHTHAHTHLATPECYGLSDDAIFDADEILVSHHLVAIRIPEHHILPLFFHFHFLSFIIIICHTESAVATITGFGMV